jgi:hypothetical protein
LFLFDTDPASRVFDTVVGYDGCVDHVIGYGGLTPENAGALVDGTIYTRGPKEKQYTAIFVGGDSMTAGEALFEAVKKRFFANFRVSVMLDINGANTTAAGVALLAKVKPLTGKRVVVLAGTGPVGMRAAALQNRPTDPAAGCSRDRLREGAKVNVFKKTARCMSAECPSHDLNDKVDNRSRHNLSCQVTSRSNTPGSPRILSCTRILRRKPETGSRMRGSSRIDCSSRHFAY